LALIRENCDIKRVYVKTVQLFRSTLKGTQFSKSTHRGGLIDAAQKAEKKGVWGEVLREKKCCERGEHKEHGARL